jgi:hypothetical protein
VDSPSPWVFAADRKKETFLVLINYWQKVLVIGLRNVERGSRELMVAWRCRPEGSEEAREAVAADAVIQVRDSNTLSTQLGTRRLH